MYDLKPGDIVRCIDGDSPYLKKDALYRILSEEEFKAIRPDGLYRPGHYTYVLPLSDYPEFSNRCGGWHPTRFVKL